MNSSNNNNNDDIKWEENEYYIRYDLVVSDVEVKLRYWHLYTIYERYYNSLMHKMIITSC